MCVDGACALQVKAERETQKMFGEMLLSWTIEELIKAFFVNLTLVYVISSISLLKISNGCQWLEPGPAAITYRRLYDSNCWAKKRGWQVGCSKTVQGLFAVHFSVLSHSIATTFCIMSSIAYDWFPDLIKFMCFALCVGLGRLVLDVFYCLCCSHWLAWFEYALVIIYAPSVERTWKLAEMSMVCFRAVWQRGVKD